MDAVLDELEKDFQAIYDHAREARSLYRTSYANLSKARRDLDKVHDDLGRMILHWDKRYGRDSDEIFGWIGSGTPPALSELADLQARQRTARGKKTTPADLRVELAKASRELDKLEAAAVKAARVGDDLVNSRNVGALAAEHISAELLGERSAFMANLDRLAEHDLDRNGQRRLDALRSKAAILLGRLDGWETETLDVLEKVADRLARFGRALASATEDPAKHPLNTRERRKTTREVMDTKVPKKTG